MELSLVQGEVDLRRSDKAEIMSQCKACGAEVSWRRIKGKNQAYNSDFSLHQCPHQKEFNAQRGKLALEQKELDQSFKRSLLSE